MIYGCIYDDKIVQINAIKSTMNSSRSVMPAAEIPDRAKLKECHPSLHKVRRQCQFPSRSLLQIFPKKYRENAMEGVLLRKKLDREIEKHKSP